MPDEKDPFDTLKDEIEIGIFETAHSPCTDPVQKINNVVGKAAELSISEMVNKATHDWIGVREKKGVCHMLVNDERLNWVSV